MAHRSGSELVTLGAQRRAPCHDARANTPSGARQRCKPPRATRSVQRRLRAAAPTSTVLSAHERRRGSGFCRTARPATGSGCATECPWGIGRADVGAAVVALVAAASPAAAHARSGRIGAAGAGGSGGHSCGAEAERGANGLPA
eukprot:364782-Chlamydomonas_euryale.AAC.19